MTLILVILVAVLLFSTFTFATAWGGRLHRSHKSYKTLLVAKDILLEREKPDYMVISLIDESIREAGFDVPK